MSQLNYLEGNQDNLYAIKNIGSTFSDAIIGFQQMKARTREMAQKQFVEQQYLQLARQKSALDMMKFNSTQQKDKAQTSEAQARTGQIESGANRQEGLQRIQSALSLNPDQFTNLLKDPGAGTKLFGALQTAGSYPEAKTDFRIPNDIPDLIKSMLAARAGLGLGQIAGSPSALEGYMQPKVMNPNQTMLPPMAGSIPGDSFTSLFETGPAAESEAQRNTRLDRDTKVEERMKQRGEEFSSNLQFKTDVLGDTQDYRARRLAIDQQKADTEAKGKQGRFANVGKSSDATFDSEQSARQSGKKKGDVIYLKGVGKVQLN